MILPINMFLILLIAVVLANIFCAWIDNVMRKSRKKLFIDLMIHLYDKTKEQAEEEWRNSISGK